ncbi:MAG: hypothetical protein B6244_07875 [Candidatus Cloacimonetes bacterium 4572_55]|nr:MAG: hypothetical protein B6244_07875 [Candidatus Cloacimonetes bacterium 4572_55]
MEKIPAVLIVESNPDDLTRLTQLIKSWNYRPLGFRHPSEALQLIGDFPISLAIAGLELPDLDGLTFLQKIQQIYPDTPTILIARKADIISALRAVNTVKPEAYLQKPVKDDELKFVIRSALENKMLLSQFKEKSAVLDKRNIALQGQNKELALQNIELIRFILKRRERYPGLVGGQDPVMQTVFDQLEVLSKIDGTVLVGGEMGTGKKTICKELHLNGLRQKNSFVSIDCAHLPEQTLRDDIFGTFEDKKKKCLLESAHRGTVVIEHIDRLPRNLQETLLSFLKTGRLPRGNVLSDVKQDVRILTTTAKNLRELSDSNQFLPELYAELSLISITIPPLRDRGRDIPLLVQHFIQINNEAYEKQIAGADPSLLRYLQKQTWSGNVGELERMIHQMCLFSESTKLTSYDLPPTYRQERSPTSSEKIDLAKMVPLKDMERYYIQETLAACGGNRSQAAQILGLKRTTLLFRMGKLGIK